MIPSDSTDSLVFVNQIVHDAVAHQKTHAKSQIYGTKRICRCITGGRKIRDVSLFPCEIGYFPMVDRVRESHFGVCEIMRLTSAERTHVGMKRS